MLEVNMYNFDEEIGNEHGRMIIADFWATWCGPCRMLSPILDEISEEMNGKVKVVRINVDENPVIAQNFMIKSLPTVMAIKQGQVRDMMVGFKPKNDVVRFINKNL